MVNTSESSHSNQYYFISKKIYPFLFYNVSRGKNSLYKVIKAAEICPYFHTSPKTNDMSVYFVVCVVIVILISDKRDFILPYSVVYFNNFTMYCIFKGQMRSFFLIYYIIFTHYQNRLTTLHLNN